MEAAQDKAELERQHALLLGKLQPATSVVAMWPISQPAGEQQQLRASPAEDGSKGQPPASGLQNAEAGVGPHHAHQPVAAPSLEELVEAYGHAAPAPPAASRALDDGVLVTAITGLP